MMLRLESERIDYMIAALYIRVSTDDQLEFSPDAQKRALIEYAKKNGYGVDEKYIYIDEGISGTSAKKRPAFMQMIGTAKKKPKPFDAILVHKFDRFARSREDSVVYKSLLRKECEIKVISITEQIEDDKFSVILEAMLEAMAEYYSLNLSDEVMKGMTEKAMRGGVQGSPPYGYKIIDNKYVVSNEESNIVKIIFNKFVNEAMTYRTIADLVNGMGARTKSGKPLEGRNIKYILQNPVYSGMVRWNYTSSKNSKIKDPSEWIIVKGEHEPIIDIELFEKANNIINTSKDYSSKRPISTEYKHWLGGLLRCSECGGTLTYSAYSKSSLTPNSKYLGYFQCNKYKKGSCNKNTKISIKNAEKMLLELLSYDLEDLKQDEYKINVHINKNDTDEKTLLVSYLSKLEKQLLNAKRAYLSDIDTLEEYKENKLNISNQISEIQNRIDGISDECVNYTSIKNDLETVISLINNHGEKDDINTLLKKIIYKIIINKDSKTFDIIYKYNQ